MSITTILTSYRRPYTLLEQIKAVRNQSIPSQEIWLWNNGSKFSFPLPEGIKIFDCNYNWSFYGRFAAACLCRTEYVSILDDDTIPGPKWYENALQTRQSFPGIIGGVGLRLNQPDKYKPNYKWGWSNPNTSAQEVDLVGHAWFLPANYIREFMFRHEPLWTNCEDMHLSAMCQIYGNIRTYVAPHRPDAPDTWSSTKGKEYGNDDQASHTTNRALFYIQRDTYVKKLIRLGWRPTICQGQEQNSETSSPIS